MSAEALQRGVGGPKRDPVSVTVALLAGGTGGAKLAAGVQEIVGSELAVIANTADDAEVHGVHVSPDPDLITYWLAGEIDEERGWGIRDDTSVVSQRLEAPGCSRLVRADGPRPRNLHLPHAFCRRGRHAQTPPRGRSRRRLG